MKQLAGTANATYNTDDTNIKHIVRSATITEGIKATAEIVSDDNANYPIYMWWDNTDNIGTIYWYCEDEEPSMNADSSNMFRQLKSLETIPELNEIDTSEVTNMSSMFNTTNIAKLDLSKFDTSKVKNMNGMFCAAKVSTLDISNWDTGNVTDMGSMFINVTTLKSLDLTHFNTKNVTTMAQMFDGMTSIEYLNLSGWTNEKLRNMGHMFRNVGRFAAVSDVVIDLTDFKTPNVTNMASLFAIDWSSSKGPKVLDLSSFNPSNGTGITGMFNLVATETIYVSEEFINAISSNSPTTTVFCSNSNGIGLVGGAGTTRSDVANANVAEYARVDDPDNGKPGYFSIKGARYIRYDGNGADNAEPMVL